MTRDQLFEYIKIEFGSEPEYLFRDTPNTAVLRNPSGKWYGILMDIPRSRLGLKGNEITDVLNVKLDPLLIGSLLGNSGMYPAYHMNKTHWISINLEEIPDIEDIKDLLDMSYQMTGKTKRPHPDW